MSAWPQLQKKRIVIVKIKFFLGVIFLQRSLVIETNESRSESRAYTIYNILTNVHDFLVNTHTQKKPVLFEYHPGYLTNLSSISVQRGSSSWQLFVSVFPHQVVVLLWGLIKIASRPVYSKNTESDGLR